MTMRWAETVTVREARIFRGATLRGDPATEVQLHRIDGSPLRPGDAIGAGERLYTRIEGEVPAVELA